MNDSKKAAIALGMNTLAFTVCFASWMAYSILIAYLVKTGEFQWTAGQIGALIAVPILTGSLMRLPIGILTDLFGGRVVYTLLMLVSAIPMYLVSFAQSYNQFWWAGLGFGLSGASFAVGVAYTSLWFPKEKQGTALGIFGAGNLGAAITTLGAPILLQTLDHWQSLPKFYALSLVIMAFVFFMFTPSKKVEPSERKNLGARLAPLKESRVWRFGIYYFLVFGGFVGLTGWLPIYYIKVYQVNLVTVGLLTSAFVLPSGLIRAFGGWLSDLLGARIVMYGILSFCAAGSLILIFNVPMVLFTVTTFMIGTAMGIGMGAVYKHIPDYFPKDVGVVGGIVGVIGGLGGYFCPKIFGILLEWTGLWTTSWMFLTALSLFCLIWMHRVIVQMNSPENLRMNPNSS